MNMGWAVAGVAWGFVGYLYASDTLAREVAWVGVAAAPFIGLAVGALGERYKDRSWPVRALFSLASLYLAVAAFFLVINIAFITSGPVLPLGMREHSALALVVGWVLSLLMAFTFLGVFLLFWPISFLTHSLFWSAGGGRFSLKPEA